METIEKVFLLKDVDVLAGADASHLALVAELAEEVRAEVDTRLLQRGRPSSAMYVLLDGAVELEGESQEIRLDRRGDAFGTWALIDAEPSLVDARAVEVTRLLRVRRARFEDLLADNPELALDLLGGLSRRVRRVLTG
jgi:CRP-like cAMP-binding protein